MSENWVSKQDLHDFYMKILPYLGSASVDIHTGFTPVGTIIPFMGVIAPQNYLACDGQIVNVADYPDLADFFEVQFGTKYKFGGSGTTFGIPDLRGEFLRGTGTNSHTNQGSGASVGNHQDATEMPFTVVNYAEATANNIYFSGDSSTGSGVVSNKVVNSDSGIPTTTYVDVSVNKDSRILRTGTYNLRYTSRPTNTSVLFCIATKNIYLDPKNDYSTEEKVIGTWYDGSTLYQKTYITTLPDTANTEKKIAHGISNLKAIVNHEACVLSANNKSITCLPWISTAGAILASIVRLDGEYIGLASNSDRSANTVIITIRYTKTA